MNERPTRQSSRRLGMLVGWTMVLVWAPNRRS